MNLPKSTKIPFTNVAREIILPVRIHYSIIDAVLFEKKLNKLKCIGISNIPIIDLLYFEEVIKTGYTIEAETGTAENWIVGKIEIIRDGCLVTVNSVERAVMIMKLFKKQFGKAVIQFKRYDIYTKVRELTEETKKFFAPIEHFFDGKKIIPKNTKEEQEIFDSLGTPLCPFQNQEDVMAFIERQAYKPVPEYYSDSFDLDEVGINAVETQLKFMLNFAISNFVGVTYKSIHEYLLGTLKSL